MLEGPASVWMVETGNGIGDTMCNCPENGPISLRLVCHHSFLISISHCLWGGGCTHGGQRTTSWSRFSFHLYVDSGLALEMSGFHKVPPAAQRHADLVSTILRI